MKSEPSSLRKQLEQLALKAPNRSNTRRFGMAVISVLVAAGLRYALNPVLGKSVPWIFFFPALMFCSWYGGFKAGLVAVSLSVLLGSVFWVEPQFHSFWSSEASLSVLIFAAVGLFMCYLPELWHSAMANLVSSQKALSEKTDQLETARTRLQAQTENLEKLVQERTAKLEETVGELEGFSYTIAHDLRSPLRAMEAYAEMLDEDYGSTLNEHAREYVRKISKSSRRMDALIQDVLSYSRVVRSDIKLECVDLEVLLRDLLNESPSLQPPLAAVEVGSPLHPVLGNISLLTQCFSNLLGNAAKFVMPGKSAEIRVWTEERTGCVRIFIQDQGIGIPPTQFEKIFHVFERAHINPGYDGTGIGLAIVKKAVEKMRGNVGVESTLHKGSKFWIELPLAR